MSPLLDAQSAFLGPRREGKRKTSATPIFQLLERRLPGFVGAARQRLEQHGRGQALGPATDGLDARPLDFEAGIDQQIAQDAGGGGAGTPPHRPGDFDADFGGLVGSEWQQRGRALAGQAEDGQFARPVFPAFRLRRELADRLFRSEDPEVSQRGFMHVGVDVVELGLEHQKRGWVPGDGDQFAQAFSQAGIVIAPAAPDSGGPGSVLLDSRQKRSASSP